MRLYKTLAVTSTVITFILISFGAFVRLNGAGLACPDWPLCYGKLIPPHGYQIALEVGHRFLASVLGILLIVQVVLSYRIRALAFFRSYSWLLLVIVTVQGIFGGLTVIMLLHPLIVTTHLFLGKLTLGLMVFWLALLFSKRLQEIGRHYYKPSTLSVLMLVVFVVMLLSGGLNSTSYSGYVCRAVPFCHPDSMWSFAVEVHTEELDITTKIPEEAGEVISQVTEGELIHMTHRVIAVTGGIFLLFGGIRTLRLSRMRPERLAAWGVIAFTLLEVVVGAVNALYSVPIPISTLHTMLASLLVIVLTLLVFYSGLAKTKT